MLSALRKRFSTIRWKLTGAFLAVSLLLALTMIVVFLAGLVYIFNAPFIPRAIAQSARDLASIVSEEIADPEGDLDQLIAQFKHFSQSLRDDPSNASGIGDSETTAPETLQLSDEVLITLLDLQGRVITSTHLQDHVPGQPLNEPGPAGELVLRAMRGITDTEQLAAWSHPDHQPIATAPVFDPDGAVAGVLFLKLTSFPPIGLILTSLAPYLVSFIVPWLLISGAIGMFYSWIVGRGFARRIIRLTEASIDLSDGDLSRRIEDPSGDEIGQLGRQFNAMADQLSESLRSLRLLADRNAQLAEQAAQLAALDERNRLARELHDSVSQELFSLTMLAAAARRTLQTRPDLTFDRLVEIEESARRALEETRSLIFALRPAALDGRGLAPALRDLVPALRERQGLYVTLRITGERPLPLEHEQALFRIVQEALANVARHSGVREAEVVLHYNDDVVTLEVRDEGRGFDPDAARNPRAIGLHSMTERAEALGGRIAIRSAPNQGTTIAVTLPARREGFRDGAPVAEKPAAFPLEKPL
ncbi:MAG: sensor histidine kinase [Oscillochloridaceae bacterium]|nr:histidine kinase [Chloroflexaceae bacterium]MDW8391749.1 sensor histidine kinase [Oscillochloridaceae bacterium]